VGIWGEVYIFLKKTSGIIKVWESAPAQESWEGKRAYGRGERQWEDLPQGEDSGKFWKGNDVSSSSENDCGAGVGGK